MYLTVVPMYTLTIHVSSMYAYKTTYINSLNVGVLKGYWNEEVRLRQGRCVFASGM